MYGFAGQIMVKPACKLMLHGGIFENVFSLFLLEMNILLSETTRLVLIWLSFAFEIIKFISEFLKIPVVK